MRDDDVVLEDVRVIREIDDTVICSINGVVRFIPSEQVQGIRLHTPGTVGTVVIPRWLADSLGLA